jgi:hypothetical protein
LLAKITAGRVTVNTHIFFGPTKRKGVYGVLIPHSTIFQLYRGDQFYLQTWLPQAILVSDWSISKNLLHQ